MTTTGTRPESEPDLTAEAPAKVNLFLEVLGRRPDGYHDIETVMQAIDLTDTIEFWSRPHNDFGISISGGDAPVDNSNLALRAARSLARTAGIRCGVHIHIHKRIPSGGGLGGGSSDAGTTLLALNRLWKVRASLPDLAHLGSGLGSDVNFFLTGGLAVCRGRGEAVEPLGIDFPAKYLLCLPQIHVSTADIYALLQSGLTAPRRECSRILRALERGEAEAVAAGMFNRLEEAAFAAYPELAALKGKLHDEHALACLLSGSGATVYALLRPRTATGHAEKPAHNLPGVRIISAGPAPALAPP